MPTFVYSRKKEYWRPLCRNQLRGETSLPSAPALPCDACLYPTEVPPVQNCWCTTVTRPQGVDSALTITLSSPLGTDSVSSAQKTASATRTYTSTGTPDATMSPVDGIKTSTISNNTSRAWENNSTDTTFIVRNLVTYLPQLRGSIDPCTWYGLAGSGYEDILYHSTIIQSTSAQSFTYYSTSTFNTRTGFFYPFTVAKQHYIQRRRLTLDNNDPASVWAGVVNDLAISYDKIRAWVPQIANGMPYEFGGSCRSSGCNVSCYPVENYCYSPTANILWETDGLKKTWYSYWGVFRTFYGYHWIVRRHASGVWLAWLYAKVAKPFSVATYTKRAPNPIARDNFVGPWRWAYTNQQPRPIGTPTPQTLYYPLSYHNALPDFIAPGWAEPGVGGTLDGVPYAYGTGMTGTARHPSWSVSIPSVGVSAGPGAYPATALALYATENLPCDFSGTASMLKIADYRTAPNASTTPVDGGPSSFPSSATLTF